MALRGGCGLTLPVFQATTQAQQTELQQRIAALETEKATLEARLKEFETGLDTRIKEQTAILQTQLQELEQKRAQLEQTAKETESRLTQELAAKEKERAVSRALVEWRCLSPDHLDHLTAPQGERNANL